MSLCILSELLELLRSETECSCIYVQSRGPPSVDPVWNLMHMPAAPAPKAGTMEEAAGSDSYPLAQLDASMLAHRPFPCQHCLCILALLVERRLVMMYYKPWHRSDWSLTVVARRQRSCCLVV